MSLHLDKLQNVHRQGGRTIARCPACAEAGHDAEGDHLVINEQGHFACVVYPGAGGKEHRSRIFQLVGDREQRCITVRPAPRSPVPKPIMTGILGRLGRVFSTSLVDKGLINDGSTESGGVIQNVQDKQEPVPAGRLGRVNQTLAQYPSDIIFKKESETAVPSVPREETDHRFSPESVLPVPSVPPRISPAQSRYRSLPEELTDAARLSAWLTTVALPPSFSLSAWERDIHAEPFRTKLLLDLTCPHSALFAPALDRARRLHAFLSDRIPSVDLKPNPVLCTSYGSTVPGASRPAGDVIGVLQMAPDLQHVACSGAELVNLIASASSGDTGIP